jgi:hypothetical protein
MRKVIQAGSRLSSALELADQPLLLGKSRLKARAWLWLSEAEPPHSSTLSAFGGDLPRGRLGGDLVDFVRYCCCEQ